MYKTYSIVNLKNGKVYVGQTVQSLEKRLIEHKCHSKTRTSPIYKAMREFGFDSFRIYLLEDNLPDQEAADESEIFWINYLNSIVPNGYNSSTGGKSKFKCSKEHAIAAQINRGNFYSDTEKKCAMCKKILSRTSFYKNKARDDGLDTRCKTCQNFRRNEERRSKNKS